MKYILPIFMAALVITTLASSGLADEPTPRDPHQVTLFRAKNACPSTGKFDGACPGWLVDHAYPLCAGGKDDPSNMRWQGRADSYVKDRLERELCALKKKCVVP